MIIAMDIGNTNIVFGFLEDNKITGRYRVATKNPRTADEYGLLLRQFLAMSGYRFSDVDDVIIASVVPKALQVLKAAILQYLDIEPIVVGPGIRTGINVRLDEPKTLGADCLVNCVGGYYEYGGPLLIIDFGTATTYNFVTGDATIVCGVISAGIRTQSEALWNSAAQLPEIEIVKPKTILAHNTRDAMQAGAYYSFIGGVEHTIEQFKNEVPDDFRVVATGGLSGLADKGTDMIDIIDPDLLLKGLHYIYNKNC
ncbi:type III pantothenate kinase [Bifidobacterium dolichotidis]|uniref:Type III pantothenate kinase n=1 Tax=Bifidobacterium dolichotidis TaxID=2306976 RepID=A0A430FPU1_9BIFI|nr:type III pantothenate kinase [Bifidobacterium dolichotidis]RSX54838.1 type III pantothenate kinase [Bifidobacterium dolichotidis]